MREYEDGYEVGWQRADEFIERHTAGMPWSALPEDDEEPENEYERGMQEGWVARIRDGEGWPTTRREVRDRFPRPR